MNKDVGNILEMCPQTIQIHRDCLTLYIYIVTTKFNQSWKQWLER